MYELKTASRLYVIEPHHGAVSAVAFSPDGRRLVTVSMDEGEVTVWKVGSSLTGFFNVGGPPRQGSERGAPYKRIPFVRPHRGELGRSQDRQLVEHPSVELRRLPSRELVLTAQMPTRTLARSAAH